MALRVIVFLLFVGSGFAALMYELVWFQLLELSLGSSAASIGVLLSTFMGGMFIGSLSRPVSSARAILSASSRRSKPPSPRRR